jgi:hypothetical protein
MDLPNFSIEKASECLHWARCNALNALPIVLDGPRETLLSCALCSGMGPALRLRSAADRMA